MAAPDDAALSLRAAALDAVERGLPPPAPAHPSVWGVVVDIVAEPGAFATVVAMGDATVSLYSSGASMIGAGGHPDVAAAAEALLVELERFVGVCAPEPGTDLPPRGRVRIHVLSADGRRFADLAEDVFWGHAPGPPPPVVGAIQNVISAISAHAPPPAAD